MLVDKFSYYVDHNNTLLELNDYQALKIDKKFFASEQDEAKLKKTLQTHLITLKHEYHPDKNPGHEVRAEIAFKRIQQAVEALIDRPSIERTSI